MNERAKAFDEPVHEEIFTFGEIAQEWLIKRMNDKKHSYVRTINIRLNKYILPELQNTPIKEITSGAILKLCRKIEARGTIETAARVKVLIGQIKYAIAMAALTKPSDIAMLMHNINSYPHAIVRCALKFSALVFCRPGEIRHAEWTEIDFEAQEWRIPAKKMKMKRVHIVPPARMNGRPMSENTIHGFRSMASTRLNEESCI